MTPNEWIGYRFTSEATVKIGLVARRCTSDVIPEVGIPEVDARRPRVENMAM